MATTCSEFSGIPFAFDVLTDKTWAKRMDSGRWWCCSHTSGNEIHLIALCLFIVFFLQEDLVCSIEYSCSRNVVLELTHDCFTVYLLNFLMLYNYWSTCLFPFITMMRLDNCGAYCLIQIKEIPAAALALLNWKMMRYKLCRRSQPALSRVYSNIFTYSLEPILLHVSLVL